VNRFDGYIADAEKWAITEANIDPEAVMDGFNQIFAGLMPWQNWTLTAVAQSSVWLRT
jgi:hypothetical protein